MTVYGIKQSLRGICSKCGAPDGVRFETNVLLCPRCTTVQGTTDAADDHLERLIDSALHAFMDAWEVNPVFSAAPAALADLIAENLNGALERVQEQREMAGEQ
ncbi:hypothetical protein DEIGR_400044 [Deinococcus grandis]|uniref:Uncharacterized protein n=1 Tax=Deinococcus grandis TaxID=57498 RepID=A0A124BSC5_9DEIO|nr:hypothetical protein [Deinococcus grandis]GAQ23911.1 hypothetical protein DEIGR_400044 [Deinococcus grandis]